MLGRALLAALAGAIVLFIWGAVYWTVLPFGNQVMGGAANEAALVTALEESLPGSGVYVVPWLEEAERGEPGEAAFQSWEQHHRRGPIVQIFYRAEGTEPMAPSVFAAGFVNMFTSSLLAVGVLALGLPLWPGYGQRVLVIFLLGLFAAVTAELSAPIWLYHPWDYAAFQSLHHLTGWLLAGLTMAGIFKPKPVAPGLTEWSGA